MRCSLQPKAAARPASYSQSIMPIANLLLPGGSTYRWTRFPLVAPPSRENTLVAAPRASPALMRRSLLFLLGLHAASAASNCPDASDTTAWSTYLARCGNLPNKGTSPTQTLDPGNEQITISWAYILQSGAPNLADCVTGVCSRAHAQAPPAQHPHVASRRHERQEAATRSNRRRRRTTGRGRRRRPG